MPNKKKARRWLAAGLIGVASVATVGAMSATPAQAARCQDCPPAGGGGGGGGGGFVDSAHYAMYLIGFSQLNGSLLKDNDQIFTSDNPGTPGYVQFTLHAAPNVRWWKEIKIFNSTGQAVAQGATWDDVKDTATLTLTTSQADGASLVFSKAKAFGVHTGVYEVHNLQAKDGRSLTFDWERDG